MSFIYYDLIVFAAFCMFVVFFLYSKRKKVKREGILFLYRSKVGIKKIEKLNKKFSWLWKKLGLIMIVAGFIFIVLIFILLIQSIILTFKIPTGVPPVMPLVPYLPQALNFPAPPFYFTYWIIIIAIIAITHEFAHGIFARFHKIEVKATGFGFLGPFLLAFVEPDEKQMVKRSKRAQLEILAAGSFSNFVFAIIFVLLMQLFFVAAYQPVGLRYVLAYERLNLSQVSMIGNYSTEQFFNLSDKELKSINTTLEIKTKDASYWLTPDLIREIPFYKKAILKQKMIPAYQDSPAFRANLSGGLIAINGQKVRSPEQIQEIISRYSPNQIITVETSERKYEIVLTQNPKDPEKGYLGIAFPFPRKGFRAFLSKIITPFFSPHVFVRARGNEQVVKFFSDLFIWLILICFFVALFNMLPVGFLDGGKFVYTSALAITKSKKKAETISKLSSCIVGIIFMFLILAWLLA